MTDTLNLDKDGYLLDITDWSPEVAEQLAAMDSITLSAAHWEIIQVLQDFYQAFEHAPSMRPFAKYIASKLGKEKSSGIYLMQLFPESPARVAARIAGLPRPDNCF
ncbi:TusE/DsrC/DsvC family sulfur relay protein [Endozoicomonadaceae bacterium StTr2]